jgi:hypothetical protein
MPVEQEVDKVDALGAILHLHAIEDSDFADVKSR